MSGKRKLYAKYRTCKPRCNGCPHGPYYSWAWREGKKVKWKYVGTEKPHEELPDQSTFSNVWDQGQVLLFDSPSPATAVATPPILSAMAQAEAPAATINGLPAVCYIGFKPGDTRERIRKRVWNSMRNDGYTEKQKHALFLGFKQLCRENGWELPKGN